MSDKLTPTGRTVQGPELQRFFTQERHARLESETAALQADFSKLEARIANSLTPDEVCKLINNLPNWQTTHGVADPWAAWKPGRDVA